MLCCERVNIVFTSKDDSRDNMVYLTGREGRGGEGGGGGRRGRGGEGLTLGVAKRSTVLFCPIPPLKIMPREGKGKSPGGEKDRVREQWQWQ